MLFLPDEFNHKVTISVCLLSWRLTVTPPASYPETTRVDIAATSILVIIMVSIAGHMASWALFSTVTTPLASS